MTLGPAQKTQHRQHNFSHVRIRKFESQFNNYRCAISADESVNM